jgi:hypothetical protein
MNDKMTNFDVCNTSSKNPITTPQHMTGMNYTDSEGM